MATSKSQRITIWVIAAMMAVGSVGFYFLIIIDNNDRAAQQAQLQQQLQDVQQEAPPADPLPGYDSVAFDASAVNELVKEDLKAGDGDVVKRGQTVKVNYMGWLPDGKIFDSSASGDEATPISLSLNQVIKGWQDGVPGMKVGGVRKLTIPAEQAYGESGSGAMIPPNTPLTFILEVTEIES